MGSPGSFSEAQGILGGLRGVSRDLVRFQGVLGISEVPQEILEVF